MKKLITLSLFTLYFSLLTSFAQHIVMMKNGDKIEGTVVSLNNGVLQLQKNQTISKINLSEIASIIFAPAGTTTKEVGEKEINAGTAMVKYKVADRLIIKAPAIDNKTQKKGTVVVEVHINKYGNVIKALPGAAGSTTSDDYLYTKAKQAAESALFNNVPTAPLEQVGYMIIPF